MKATKKIIIAVDGHSSCGKSTLSKEVAKKIGIGYVDTGAMYRSVTLYGMRKGIVSDDELRTEELVSRLGEISISFKFDQEKGRNTTYLNGENVEDEIRTIEVSRNVSKVSAIKEVRAKLTDWQRHAADEGSVIMDGRDIGTVVFPQADLKIFMTATAEVRAQRRYDELIGKGEQANYEEVLANVKERDEIDSTREVSPLRKADDALLLDNSNLSREEQYDVVIGWLKERNLVE
ncbi:MAG: (d)CMP kinase [Bacteroidales bacterium]|nr:(d)CMP kinase [Bacteroidales bacterium]